MKKWKLTIKKKKGSEKNNRWVWGNIHVEEKRESEGDDEGERGNEVGRGERGR